MIGSYARFRNRVLTELTAYQLDGRDQHLSMVARTLPPSRALSGEIRVRIRFIIEGWLDPGLLPDEDGMRRRNPDFRFKVRRYERSDVGVGSRYGFRIHATARRSAATADHQPVFRAKFVNRSGKERVLPASHAMTAHILSRCQPGRREPNLKKHKGFIDDIRVSLRVPDRARDLWVASLVTEHPASLRAFADSPQGEPWRDAFVRSLELIKANDRWADQYRLIASGLRGEFTSDLVALAVDRPRPDRPIPSPAVRMPRTHDRGGGLVDFISTETPMAAPDTRWLTVDTANVQDGGTVTTNGRLVNYETAADPSLAFVAGTWESSFGSMSHPEVMLLQRRPPAETEIPEGILIAGRNDDNWYHWFVEYLPRALTVPPGIDPEVPFLVSRRTPATGVDALREVSERPITLIHAKRSQAVRRLHVAPPVVQVLDAGYADWTAATTVDRAPLDTLRAHLGVDVPREGEGRRIFLVRRSVRRGIRNEAALAKIAAMSGLELVDPAGLTFAEQRKLFSSAELVVGASGAVMANYLMMRPGSKVIALTSQQLRGFVLPAVLAAVAGCSFQYVLGRSDVRKETMKDANQWIHADFTVDEATFATTLCEALPRSHHVSV
jgi:capsular polysaccharide biosynthesis protein